MEKTENDKANDIRDLKIFEIIKELELLDWEYNLKNNYNNKRIVSDKFDNLNRKTKKNIFS
jgi:hypothetical protein